MDKILQLIFLSKFPSNLAFFFLAPRLNCVKNENDVFKD